MTLDRHLARLLAAVIVMIAATFGVSVAQAHEGHAHHPHAPTVVTAAVVSASSAQSTAADPAMIQQARQPAAPMVLALATQADADDDVGRTGGCDGRCCSTSMACCHAAVTPATLATFPQVRLSSLVPASQQTAPSSLTLEALPKPPRSFAA